MNSRGSKRKLTKVGNSVGVTLPSEMLYKLDHQKKYEVVFEYIKKSSNPEIWKIYIKEVRKSEKR